MPLPDLSALASSDWKVRRRAVEELAQRDSLELAQGLLELIRLHHQDLNTLNASLTLLQELKTPVTDGLVALLEDRDAEVRQYAALALGEVKDQASIPALLSLLADADRNVRFNAVEALGKLRARQAVGPLTEILHSQDFFLFFGAVQALMEIGDPQPVPDLLSLLPVEAAAPSVVQALGHIGGPQVIDPILRWLETDKGEVASALMALVDLARRHPVQAEVVRRLHPASFQKILNSIPPEIPPHPQAGEIQFYSALVEILGWLYQEYPGSPQEIRRILGGLVHLLQVPDDKVHHAAFHTLEAAGEQAAAELTLALQNSSGGPRLAYARLLSALSDPVSVPALLEALEMEDEAAPGAARGLGKIAQAHPEFQASLIDPLVSRLDTGSPSLRHALVEALSGFEDSLLATWIGPLARDPDPALRLAALSILTQSGKDLDLSILQAALQDESPQVQRLAIESLDGWPAQQAMTILARFLRHEQAVLRAAAAKTLGRPSFVQQLSPDQALPLLYPALEDPDPWTRLAACQAVGRYARPESLDFLSKLKDDPDPPVRAALAETLIQFGGPAAQALLVELLSDAEDVVQQAAQKAWAQVSTRWGADGS